MPDSESISLQMDRAAAGDVVAQVNLAHRYLTGSGVPRDARVGVFWLRKAAEQNDPEAEFNLGLAYETGDGVEQSFERAAELYKKAVEKHLPAALFNLANLYRGGNGVREDRQRAKELYTEAAAAGDLDSTLALGYLADSDDPTTDASEAVDWYRIAADRGSRKAQERLGWMYENGHGVPRNEGAAATFYERAVQSGSEAAAFNLALMFEDGRGLRRDDTRARELYEKAAALGSADAPESRKHVRRWSWRPHRRLCQGL